LDELTTVVVLVRPQADKIQSLVNDKTSSGSVSSADAFAESHFRDIENNFTHTWLESKKLYSKVIVVHRDDLLSTAGVREVLKRILPNEVQRPVLRPIHPNRFSQRDSRHRQLTLSLEMRWKIEEYFKDTNYDLYFKTGVYLTGDCT